MQYTMYLARDLLALAKYEEAEKLLRRVTDVTERTFGEDDAVLLFALDDLAMAVHFRGRDKEAEQLARRCFELRQRKYGEEDVLTLGSKATLARMLTALGRYKEAL